MAESIAGVSEAELNERIDVGIAFLVLLFMVGLGAYLMTMGDSESTFLQADAGAQLTGATAGSVLERPGSTTEKLSTDNLDRQDRLDRLEAREPAVAVDTPQLIAPDIDSQITQPATVVSEIVQTSAPVLEEPVVQEIPVQEPVVQVPVAPEPIAPEPIASEPIAPEPVIQESVAEEPALTAEESAVLSLATENVSFVTGSAVLTEESKTILDQILVLLGQRKDARLSVVGHTDSMGDADDNVALSFARAEACRDYLLARGATVGQVDSAGMGERQPIADNSTAAGRKANRRVEFRLLRSGG